MSDGMLMGRYTGTFGCGYLSLTIANLLSRRVTVVCVGQIAPQETALGRLSIRLLKYRGGAA